MSTTNNDNTTFNNENKKKTKEDLRVTDLGQIEPLYDEFGGEMYGKNRPRKSW
jgi:hypothetical protein